MDMLDKNGHAKIRYLRVNEETGKEVQWNDIVKGYKYDEDYVILTDEDFDQVSVKKSQSIEISEFVDEKEIDSIYYTKPYYLEPEKSGKKAYVLLREALLKSNKVGVGTFVMRSKENLVVIKPLEKALILNQIRFHQEVRAMDDLELPEKTDIKSKEIDLAVQLIEQYSKPFDITEYKDTYNDELMKLIEAKAKGKAPKVKKMEVAPTKTQDLMAQLKASLQQSRKAS
jgi:DNA end-binding protein Ku